jgi:hypothetical protein
MRPIAAASLTAAFALPLAFAAPARAIPAPVDPSASTAPALPAKPGPVTPPIAKAGPVTPAAPVSPPPAKPVAAGATSLSVAGAAEAGNLEGDVEAHPVREDPLEFSDTFVLDTGRKEFRPPSPEGISFSLRGEYQLRYRAMSDLRLQAPVRHPEATTLGQNQYLYHWLRIHARFSFKDKVSLVAQIDFPRGLIVGDTTRYVDAARDSLSQAKWSEVHPRWLYLEYDSPIGIFRLGQQGSHWGMGLVANDGDHPTLFGDYQRGSLSERLLFATTPLGKGSPLSVAVAGDVIFQDQTADLVLDHDRAFQGVLALLYRTKPAEVGFYGVIRHQERDHVAVDALTPYTDSLTVGVLDVTGKFNTKVPGTSAFAYGQLEAAVILGSTSFLRGAYGRATDPTLKRDDELVRSFGAAAMLGATRVTGTGKDAWGDLVAEVETGYASGDADSNDGVSKRFTFDANHRVGLVLFNQVLAWKTARSATIAQDPDLVARAAPGLGFLPSKGGVFGAQYLNPRMIVRPRRWLDLKTGVVIAQTTADLVDPYHQGALGNIATYDGGDPRRHDLGLELDFGANVRVPVDTTATVQAGVEGGVLFPGHAFDDVNGGRLANQYLVNLALGIQF